MKSIHKAQGNNVDKSAFHFRNPLKITDVPKGCRNS